MNKAGEKINYEVIANQSRLLDRNELMRLLQSNKMIYWSWGVNFKTITINSKDNCRMLRLTVNGHHHKGFVYIFVNGSDLFDVYLTTKKGTIKKIMNDIYFDMLVTTIDDAIEKIPEYST